MSPENQELQGYSSSDEFYKAADPGGVDSAHITEALRITFHGWYDEEEDDFEGRTFFTRSLTEDERPEQFSRKHKQVCGFLYLRSHRTGSRALSLERGSLLDIILRLKELRPQMWEDTLSTLSAIAVASHPDLGISPVLESISTSLKKYVPKEWGVEPHLRVSNLTREHLRKVITAFTATGDGDHAAPYYRQGTGTINMLVLAMLSQIAEGNSAVIKLGQGLKVAESNRDVASLVRWLTLFGHGYVQLDRSEQAIDFYDRALKVATSVPELQFPVMTYLGKGNALVRLGRFAVLRVARMVGGDKNILHSSEKIPRNDRLV